MELPEPEWIVARAKELGYTLTQGVTLDTENKRCCPLGLLALDAGETELPLSWAFEHLDLPGTLDVAGGFDGTNTEPKTPEYLWGQRVRELSKGV